MAVRRLIEIGDPVLRRKAAPVPAHVIGSAEIRGLLDDMVDTMRASGGIGLAAPQVGESIRVAAIEIAVDSSRYPDMQPFPLTFFINPVVTVLDESGQSFWEGCLSVPGLRGLVTRPRSVRVDWLGVRGETCSLVATGFLATVFQHELDHLDGILFVDRMPDTTRLATIENYLRFWRDVNPEQAEL
jgi:peptide deformylase